MKIVHVLTSIVVLVLIAQSVRCGCPHVCGPYEEYSECGTACEETCSTPPNQVCTLQCVKGCFCKPGYVREHKDGLCIPKCRCPKCY